MFHLCNFFLQKLGKHTGTGDVVVMQEDAMVHSAVLIFNQSPSSLLSSSSPYIPKLSLQPTRRVVDDFKNRVTAQRIWVFTWKLWFNDSKLIIVTWSKGQFWEEPKREEMEGQESTKAKLFFYEKPRKMYYRDGVIKWEGQERQHLEFRERETIVSHFLKGLKINQIDCNSR